MGKHPARQILILITREQTLIKKFKTFSIEHTVREDNKHADELASRGIDEV